MSTEYLHLVVVPVLTHLLPVATLGLLIALLVGKPPATKVALFLVLLSAASVWPAVHYGEASYDQVKSMSYQSGVEWLDVHAWRADRFAWVFYTAAALSLLALIIPLKIKRLRLPLATLTLAAAIGACAAAFYIAYAGGRVRHKELREGAKPPAHELSAARADQQEAK